MSHPTAAVFGAYGHTGRFVVSELQRRGWGLILSGRDATKLDSIGASRQHMIRRASVEDPESLDRVLEGADVVINTAGPFAFTAAPLIEAAIRGHIPYLDVAAEIEANLDTFKLYEQRAREAEIVVLPAMAFFGGLGDLLVTAALDDWRDADEISIAYGLDSWRPTAGTLAAGNLSSKRRNGRRLVFSDGSLHYRSDAAPHAKWVFPEPLGEQPVIGEFTMADTVTISRHVRSPQIRSYLTTTAVEDLNDESSQLPMPADGTGPSSQNFVVDAVVRSGDSERRATASGRDIYAFSAALIVRAAQHILSEQPVPGVYSAGELFNARGFLQSLSPQQLDVRLSAPSDVALTH